MLFVLCGLKRGTTLMYIVPQEQNQVDQGATHRDTGRTILKYVKMEREIIKIVELGWAINTNGFTYL